MKSHPPPGIDKSDWSVPKPDVIPPPTYAPAATALGITFAFWGLITSPVVLAAGVLVAAWGLRVWIGEIHRGE
jgi:hypothetical protein